MALFRRGEARKLEKQLAQVEARRADVRKEMEAIQRKVAEEGTSKGEVQDACTEAMEHLKVVLKQRAMGTPHGARVAVDLDVRHA